MQPAISNSLPSFPGNVLVHRTICRIVPVRGRATFDLATLTCLIGSSELRKEEGGGKNGGSNWLRDLCSGRGIRKAGGSRLSIKEQRSSPGSGAASQTCFSSPELRPLPLALKQQQQYLESNHLLGQFKNNSQSLSFNLWAPWSPPWLQGLSKIVHTSCGKREEV